MIDQTGLLPSGSPHLRISYADGVAHIVGELDMDTSAQLDAALAALQPGAPFVVDMAEVSFIDSSGLRALLVASADREVTLLNPSDRVRAVVEMTGLGSTFHLD